MDGATKAAMIEAAQMITKAIDTLATGFDALQEIHRGAQHQAYVGEGRSQRDTNFNNALPLDRVAGDVAQYMRHKGLGLVLQMDYGPAGGTIDDLEAAISKRIRGL